VGQRQRAKPHGVEDAEHGRAEADGDGQDRGGADEVRRMPTEVAKGVVEISEEAAWPGRPRASGLFLDRGRIAELEKGCAPRIRYAARPEFRFAHLEVKTHLIVEVTVQLVVARLRASCEQAPKWVSHETAR
jgi:hypothetical protein